MTYFKPKVLFIVEAATLAHISRSLTLASKLSPNQFEIVVAARDSYPFVWGQFTGARLPLDSRTPAQFQSIIDSGGVLFDEETLARYVREERLLIDAVKPDVIVGDLRPSLSVSARLARVPYLNLTNAYWNPHATPVGFPMPCTKKTISSLPKGVLGRGLVRGLERISGPMVRKAHLEQGEGINRIRTEHGLPAFDDYLAGFTDGDFTLYADSPVVVNINDAPASHRFIGPLSWSAPVSLPSWSDELRANERIVYLSLGSSGRSELLPQIIAALDELGFPVVVTASDKTTIPEASRVRVYRAPLLPAEEMCRRAALVICNGGSPAVYQALTHGVPVIGVPYNMDQLLFMRHVERSGSGLSIRADLLTTSEVRRAVRKILKDSSFVFHSRRIARTIQEIDAAHEFENIITEALRTHGNERVHNM